MKKTTAKKKVLIIGSKGMLGQALADVFSGDGDYSVVAWDREDIDITKKSQVSRNIKRLNPDIIINAAAYNAVDKCETEKKEFEIAQKINGLAPGYLAQAAKKAGAILVHYSTDYVFDGEPDIPEPLGCNHSCSSCALHDSFVPEIGFDEKSKTRPISKYGKTKLMGEREVKKEEGRKGAYYIIRLSKLFGKAGVAEGAKKSFFDVMLELGKKNKEVRVVDEETSCFTYAPDLARKTKEIIESQKPYGIYHVTNSGAVTWYEAVLALYRISKLKTKVIPISGMEFPRPARRPYVSTLINTKLNPMRSYEEALKAHLGISSKKRGNAIDKAVQ